jgi:hypothetical protein
MDAKRTELELAVAHVQELEALISEQRARIKRLKQLGASTTVAESLLAALQDSLARLDQHLIFVLNSVVVPTATHANKN